MILRVRAIVFLLAAFAGGAARLAAVPMTAVQTFTVEYGFTHRGDGNERVDTAPWSFAPAEPGLVAVDARFVTHQDTHSRWINDQYPHPVSYTPSILSDLMVDFIGLHRAGNASGPPVTLGHGEAVDFDAALDFGANEMMTSGLGYFMGSPQLRVLNIFTGVNYDVKAKTTVTLTYLYEPAASVPDGGGTAAMLAGAGVVLFAGGWWQRRKVS